MPKIDVDFSDVPMEIPAIPPGEYTVQITEVPQVIPTNDGTGTKVVVSFSIFEGPFKGRRLQDHISLKMTTRLKRLAVACGEKVGVGGLNTEDLAGKTLKVNVKTRAYKDSSGVDREGASISDYVIL